MVVPAILPGNASDRVAALADLLGVELGATGVGGDRHFRRIGRADRPLL
jgi:hypothetical protein